MRYFLESGAIIILFICGIVDIHSQPGQCWEWLHPKPTSNTLRTVAHLDGKIYIAGNGGQIFSSLDFGKTWKTEMDSVFHHNIFNDIDTYGSDYIAVAGGEIDRNSLVAISADNGNNWKYKETNFGDLEAIAFLTPDHLIAASTSNVIESFDSGDTWNDISAKVGGLNNFILTASAFNDQLCLLGGISGKLYLTTDGGGNWTLLNVPFSDNVNDIDFINEDEWYITTHKEVYHTTNAGQNWTRLYHSTFPSSLDQTEIVGDVIIVSGWDGTIARFNGANWQKVASSLFNDPVEGLVTVDPMNIIGVGGSGFVIETNDTGASWKIVTENNNLLNAHTIAKTINQEWAVFGRSGCMKSNDEGETWTKLTTFNNVSCASIKDNHWIALGNQRVYHSHDNGINWQENTISEIGAVNDVINFDQSFYCVNNVGKIFRSNDYGRNWSQVFIDTDANWNKIKNVNDEFVIVVGWNGSILKSVDGVTWSYVYNSGLHEESLYDVSYNSKNEMIATGISSFISKDGNGLNWQKLTTGQSFENVQYINDTICVMVNGNSNMYISRDNGGLFEEYIHPPISSIPLGLDWVDDRLFYLGYEGAVLSMEMDCLVPNSGSSCRTRDSLVLVALYQATDGPNWTNQWDLDQPMNTWWGIDVNASGCVTCIDLDNNGSQCFLSNGLVSGNNLNGKLPDVLGELSELSQLYLSGNNIIGRIPPSFYNLTKLSLFSCGSCQLEGEISQTIENLESLTFLGLTNNNLTGKIPSELFLLPGLRNVGLSSNRLEGAIPSSIQFAQRLESLALHENRLNGDIPGEIGNATALRSINLSGNGLTGVIPSSIGQLGNLISLYLNRNDLSGSLPLELFDLDRLQNLGLSDNQLGGKLSPEIRELAGLQDLFLGKNNFEGPLPRALANLLELENVVLSENSFEGCIPLDYQRLCTINQFLILKNPLLPWEGDRIPFCSGENQLGAPCNDGDSTTTNDRIQDINGICTCQGDRCKTADTPIDRLICQGEQIIWGGQTISQEGVYRDTLLSVNDCDSIVIMTVMVDDPMAVIAGPAVIPCNDTITLQSTSHISTDRLSWGTTNGIITSDVDAAQILIASPGTYVLQVISENDCIHETSWAVTGDFPIIENVATLEATCPDLDNGKVLDVSISGGNPPYQYSYNGMDYLNSIDELGELALGNHRLFIKDVDGCLSQRNFTILGDEELEVDLLGIPNAEIDQGDTLYFEVLQNSGGNIISYDWTQGATDGLSCLDCANPILVVGTTSKYTLWVEDDAGCVDIVTFSLNIKQKESKDVITPNGDGVNDDLVFDDLDPTKNKDAQILIINRWGQVVYQDDHYKNDWPTKDPNSDKLPEGTYYYQVTIDVFNGPFYKGNVLLLR